jgi:hypothetical protein
MKSRQYVLSIALALLLDGMAAHSLFAQNEPVDDHNLSQTEAKDLARSASTPEDHLKLAAYFRDQAQQEEAASGFDQQLASANHYDQEMKEHFGYLAKKTSKAAVKLNRMAAEEEGIAKEMLEHPLRRGGFHK